MTNSELEQDIEGILVPSKTIGFTFITVQHLFLSTKSERHPSLSLFVFIYLFIGIGNTK